MHVPNAITSRLCPGESHNWRISKCSNGIRVNREVNILHCKWILLSFYLFTFSFYLYLVWLGNINPRSFCVVPRCGCGACIRTLNSCLPTLSLFSCCWQFLLMSLHIIYSLIISVPLSISRTCLILSRLCWRHYSWHSKYPLWCFVSSGRIFWELSVSLSIWRIISQIKQAIYHIW